MTTLCYKVLEHLPKVPQEYVDIAISLAKEKSQGIAIVDENTPMTTDPTFLNSKEPIQNCLIERILTRDGEEFTSRLSPRFSIEDHMAEWVTKNINEEWAHIGVTTNIRGDSINNIGHHLIQGPHTDATRQYALIYLVETSNLDQDTVFWHQEGKSLRRKRCQTPVNLDEMIEIGRIQLPMHTWLYFDTSILHSIENVQGTRISIQVGFDCEPFGVFLKG